MSKTIVIVEPVNLIRGNCYRCLTGNNNTYGKYMGKFISVSGGGLGEGRETYGVTCVFQNGHVEGNTSRFVEVDCDKNTMNKTCYDARIDNKGKYVCPFCNTVEGYNRVINHDFTCPNHSKKYCQQNPTGGRRKPSKKNRKNKRKSTKKNRKN
jgi:hypothetical protein